MTQVLIVGFNCFVYQQSPRARIYINDFFIDEFYINEFINEFFLMRFKKKEEEIYNRIQRNIKNTGKNVFNFYSCPPLLCWELNDNIFEDENKIKIEIKNQDNNYSNGFMTYTTYLELMHLYLLPKKTIERYLKLPKKSHVISEKTVSRTVTPVFENYTNYSYFHSLENKKNPNHATLFTTADTGHFETVLYKHKNRFKAKLQDQFGIIKDKTIISKQSRDLQHTWKSFVFDKYLQYENI